MPEVKCFRSAKQKQAERLEAQIAKLNKDTLGAVGEIRGRYQLRQNDVAEMTGFNTGTFSLRLKNPEKFTLEEMLKMFAAFPEMREKFISSLQSL